MWFTDNGTTKAIGRITPSGAITEFSAGLQASNKSGPISIAPGPDGNMWFTDLGVDFAGGLNGIGKITPSGAISEFFGAQGTGNVTEGSTTIANVSATSGTFTVGESISSGSAIPAGTTITAISGTVGSETLTISAAATATEVGATLIAGVHAPVGIAPGPDGNMWFTENSLVGNGLSTIGRVTPSGAITEFSVGLQGSNKSAPVGIAAGPDGNMWFTDDGFLAGGNDMIGRIAPSGAITEFSTGLQESNKSVPISIAPGADGNLWFTDQGSGMGGSEMIGRIAPSGAITEFAAPAGSKPGGSFFVPSGIAPGADGNLWFADEGATPAIGQFGVGAPAASVRAPSVIGSLQEQTQQTCGDDSWANWAGIQPEDGGLLESSTAPPAVEWFLGGGTTPVSTARTYTPAASTHGQTLSCRENVTYRYPLGVTVSKASSTVTLIAQSQGPPGAEGKEGKTGTGRTAGRKRRRRC